MTVIDEVQVLDQTVAARHFRTEQLLHLGECLRIDHTASWKLALALAAGAGHGDWNDGMVHVAGGPGCECGTTKRLLENEVEVLAGTSRRSNELRFASRRTWRFVATCAYSDIEDETTAAASA
jgi:hypothetical protein